MSGPKKAIGNGGSVSGIDAPRMSPGAIHRQFSRLRSDLIGNKNAEFVEIAHDVCNGIALCLELTNGSDLVRQENFDEEPGDERPPILGVVDTERLLFFARAAAALLASNAEHHIEWLNECAPREKKNGGGHA